MSAGPAAAGPGRPAAGGPAPQGRGVALGLSAFVLWGLFPLYFPLMAPAGALEVLLHRVLWALVACAVALVALAGLRRPGWAPLLALARSPRELGLVAVAAAAIALNWGVYIYATTTTGHVIEASLGYFINPLVTVALAVLVLHERLRRLQWVAVGLGAVAVVVITAAYGRPPWIALVLAASFGTYGLLKRVLGASGARLSALTSLTAETAVLAPLAVVALVVLEVTGRGTFSAGAPWHALLLASTGVVTAVPLLLFAASAGRVPLTTTGMLQYVTPVLQLLIGVVVLGEQMPAARWAGFALVWVALVLLTADALRAARAGRPGRAAPADRPGPSDPAAPLPAAAPR